MLRMNVTGGYSDFKAVVGALGKPAAVFWSRIEPSTVKMWAIGEGTVVMTQFTVPPAVNPASPPDPNAVGSSPLAPAKAAADAKPAADQPKDGSAPAKPKTVLETDFPGAVELPGGAVEIS